MLLYRVASSLPGAGQQTNRRACVDKLVGLCAASGTPNDIIRGSWGETTTW